MKITWVGAGAAAGFLWLGPVGAAVGAIVGAAAGPALRLRDRRRRSERIDEALVDFVVSVAAAVRAGSSAAAAVAEADAAAPLDDAVAACVARLRAGAPFDDALTAFAEVAGTPQARTVVVALSIGHRSGGDLPHVLDALAQIARDRTRLAREVRASSAQARMSSWIVALLPVVFLFLTGAASRDQMTLLLRTPAGCALLGAGLGLEGIGIVWMRRLGRVR